MILYADKPSYGQLWAAHSVHFSSNVHAKKWAASWAATSGAQPTHSSLTQLHIGAIELQSDGRRTQNLRGVSRTIQKASSLRASTQAVPRAASSRATEAIKGQPPQQRQNEGLPVGPRAPVLYEGSHAGLPRAGARGAP